MLKSFTRYFKNAFSTNQKLYVFGDSHARVFNYINERLLKKQSIEVLAIGGATAQGLANPRSKTNALKLYKEKINLSCKKKDKLFFFLGEVDCGFVIWYRSKKYNEPVDFQFNKSLKNYKEFLLNLKNEGYREINIIETVLPTIFDGFEGQIAHERKEVTVSIKERTELTKRYNNKLGEIAAENNFGFVRITQDILDKKTGLIKQSLLNEDKKNHHLSNIKFAPIMYKNVMRVLNKT